MKRRYLTPKEREEMLVDQGNHCPLCWETIGPQPDGSHVPFIAEHWAPVALGNDQKPDCLLCIPCANRKTNGTPATTYGSDKHAIAKAKRLHAASILHGWHMGESVRETALRLGITSYRVREVRYRQPRKSRKLEGQGFQSKPEGYATSWPSREIPSRPMKREARR